MIQQMKKGIFPPLLSKLINLLILIIRRPKMHNYHPFFKSVLVVITTVDVVPGIKL